MQEDARWLTLCSGGALNEAETSAHETVYCGRDKSLTHRAIIFAAMANGSSTVDSPLLGQDCLSTLACFKALGVEAELRKEPDQLLIRSNGVSSFRSPDKALDCGNSGTSARLFCGLFAGIPGLSVEMIGDESLSSRPMRRVVEPLRRMGADITGPGDGEYLPLKIKGQTLRACRHEVDKASAQIKSALLLAAIQTKGTTTISLPTGARNHTELMLKRWGASCRSEEVDGQELISFDGPWKAPHFNGRVPVDPSSAAFFAVLALLRPSGSLELPEILDNPTRLGFLTVLRRMSKTISWQGEDGKDSSFFESVGTLRVHSDPMLAGCDIEAHEVPSLVDEIPCLAVAAAFASGPSEFHGLGELRVKESDRLEQTALLLQSAGAKVSLQGDMLRMEGGLRHAKAFRFDPLGDHRLAMAAAVLATRADGPCHIKDPDCAAVSFPNFYEQLARVSRVSFQ